MPYKRNSMPTELPDLMSDIAMQHYLLQCATKECAAAKALVEAKTAIKDRIATALRPSAKLRLAEAVLDGARVTEVELVAARLDQGRATRAWLKSRSVQANLERDLVKAQAFAAELQAKQGAASGLGA